MAIWMDMTNSLHIWQGGVVGIIKAELEIAKNVKRLNPELRFCVSREDGIDEIESHELEWLWQSNSVSDAYIANMKKRNTKNGTIDDEIPEGLLRARSYSEGRLERINRAGNLWIESMDGVCRQLASVGFNCVYLPLKICSKIRMKTKKRSQEVVRKKKFYHPFKEGDIIFSCGWYNNNNNYYHLKVKSLVKNITLCYLIYDLVLVKPELKALFQETSEFEWYISWIANNCDHIFYGGKTAQKDAEKFFKDNKLPIKPAHVVKFGSEIVQNKEVANVADVLHKYGIEENYILAVGSVAPKKNYSTMYKAYTIMLKNYMRDNIPQLVIVGGKYGEGYFVNCIELDPCIKKKIIIIGPTDEELDILYRNCMFTVLPTLYEGWSLTLPEALAYNKFCLLSDVEPLREIAGDLGKYVEPMDPVKWAEKIYYYANHLAEVKECEISIKKNWKPITWADCGKQVNDYLRDIFLKKTNTDKHLIYYDMTLTWQLAQSGASVSGILRTQLLLAKYLCYIFPTMRLCAFTEFGYVNIDRYTISSILKQGTIEKAFQDVQIQMRKLYLEEAETSDSMVPMVKVHPQKRALYKEIFWLVCSSLPSKMQQLVIKKWRERKKRQESYVKDISLPIKRIKYDIPFDTGDVFFSTGVGLGTQAYEALLELKQHKKYKFIQLLYDFTPVVCPQFHLKETRNNYVPFLKYTYKLSDMIFYGGKTAMRDGEHYQKNENMELIPGKVIKFGSDILNTEEVSDDEKKAVFEKYNIKGSYIMAVGSIEARKNHETLYHAYIDMMLQETDLPQMLFCGYPGWKTEEFRAVLGRDERVKNRVMIITPTDRELEVLYKNCEFTLLASLYEGWSLTLPESLNYGKFCLVSDVDPLREIGEDFVEYIGAYDIKKWSDRILFYHKNKDILREKETHIREAWHAISWEECSKQVADGLIEQLERKEKK